MAESSNEFTVEVDVSGDFTKLREGLRREIDAMQKAGVSVPVGAPGAPGVAPAGGGTSLSMPAATAAQVMWQYGAGANVAGPSTPAAAAMMAAQRAGLPPPSFVNIPNMAAASVGGFGGGGFYNPAGTFGSMTGGPPVIGAGGSIFGAVAEAATVQATGRSAAAAGIDPRGLRFSHVRSFATALGVIDVARAQQALNRGALETALAPTMTDAARAQLQGVQNAGRGFFGSMALEALDLFGGPLSPSGIRQDIEFSAAIDQSIRGRTELMMSRRGGERVRDAAVQYGLAGAKAAKLQVETDQQTRTLNEEAAALRSRLASIPEQVPAQQFQLIRRERARLAELEKQIPEVGRQSAFELTQLRFQQGVERMQMAAETAGFRDIARGLPPSVIERGAMIRRQGVEFIQTAFQDVTLLPNLQAQHLAERQAFEATERRSQHVRDVETAGYVRTAGLQAENRPFAAQISEIGSEIEAARAATTDPRERVRIERRGIARMGFAAADFMRGENAYRLAAGRDALAAELATIPGEQQERRKFVIQREADERTMVGLGVTAREQVSTALADRTRPFAERVTEAQALGIANAAIESAEAFRLKGRGYERFAIQEEQTGRNRLRAAADAFRASLHVEEIESISRVALTGGSIDRQLASFRDAERRIDAGIGALGGAAAPRTDEATGGMPAKVDETNLLLRDIKQLLEAGVPAGP